jgi:hypothetical protein
MAEDPAGLPPLLGTSPHPIGAADNLTAPHLGVRTMSFQGGLTTDEIATIFADEIGAQGGIITDKFDDGSRLFLRAVLRAEQEVMHRDRVQGGVALRATEDDVWVHPYVFRQVCSNGAIIARSTQSRHIEHADFSGTSEAELAGALREAIEDCCAPEAFENAAEAMRSSVHSPVDMALTMAPMLSRMPATIRGHVLDSILRQFGRGSDRSRFAIMNVVTAVARDTPDPELRWRLEEIGGAIPFENDAPVLERSRVLTV